MLKVATNFLYLVLKQKYKDNQKVKNRSDIIMIPERF